MGGAALADAGADIVVDTTGAGVIGYTEVLRVLPRMLRAKRTLLDHLEGTRPDAVVLVDYPGFHLRLAIAIKKRFPDLPVFYYVAPKLWAWKEGRIRAMRTAVDHVFCIFPFEVSWFASRGVSASYVGNPNVDAVVGADGAALREALAVPDAARIVGVFPGSRPQEVARFRSLLEAAAARLKATVPDLVFVEALAPGLEAGADRPDGWRTTRENHALMAAADLVLAKSGTTTLETMLVGTPMVIVYRVGAVSYRLMKWLSRTPWVGLPNILAQASIVPELLQDAFTPERVAAEAGRLLTDPAAADAQRKAFAEERERLGDEPSGPRAVRALLERLGA